MVKISSTYQAFPPRFTASEDGRTCVGPFTIVLVSIVRISGADRRCRAMQSAPAGRSLALYLRCLVTSTHFVCHGHRLFHILDMSCTLSLRYAIFPTESSRQRAVRA